MASQTSVEVLLYDMCRADDARYHGDKPQVPDYIHKLSNSTKRTPQCQHVMNFQIEQIVEQVKTDISYNCARALVSWRKCSTRSRDYEIVQFAKRVLFRSDFRVFGNDKDGGYSLVRRSDVPLLQGAILSNGNYVSVEVSTWGI